MACSNSLVASECIAYTMRARELSYIFAAIDADANGSLSVEEIEKWVIATVRPKLSATEVQALQSGLEAVFNDREVLPEDFSEAFNCVIRAIADVRRRISAESLAKSLKQSRRSLERSRTRKSAQKDDSDSNATEEDDGTSTDGETEGGSGRRPPQAPATKPCRLPIHNI